MTHAEPARAAFDARLRELRLDGLAPQEVARLWQNRLKQIEITDRLLATLDPAAESALQLVLPQGGRA